MKNHPNAWVSLDLTGFHSRLVSVTFPKRIRLRIEFVGEGVQVESKDCGLLAVTPTADEAFIAISQALLALRGPEPRARRHPTPRRR